MVPRNTWYCCMSLDLDVRAGFMLTFDPNARCIQGNGVTLLVRGCSADYVGRMCIGGPCLVVLLLMLCSRLLVFFSGFAHALCPCFVHALLMLCSYFARALLMLCQCFAHALLMLCYCFAHALLVLCLCFSRAMFMLCSCLLKLCF